MVCPSLIAKYEKEQMEKKEAPKNRSLSTPPSSNKSTKVEEKKVEVTRRRSRTNDKTIDENKETPVKVEKKKVEINRKRSQTNEKTTVENKETPQKKKVNNAKVEMCEL